RGARAAWSRLRWPPRAGPFSACCRGYHPSRLDRADEDPLIPASNPDLLEQRARDPAMMHQRSTRRDFLRRSWLTAGAVPFTAGNRKALADFVPNGATAPYGAGDNANGLPGFGRAKSV